MAHEHVYAICENKCWEETMTKEQIEKYAVTSDITETEIPVTEVYNYDGMGQEEFDQPEEYTVVDGHGIAYRQMFVHKIRNSFSKGDKFTFGEMGINSHGTVVGIYVLTEKTPGDEPINIETDCVYQGKMICAVENVYNTETIMFTQDCEGYLCIVFNPVGTVTMRIKELKVIKKPADLAQLRFKEYDIFPKTTKVIESETVPAEIVIKNREEIRFTGDAVSAAITVNPTISGNDYYAMIIVKTSFTSMTSGDFVQFTEGVSGVVINSDLDISEFAVVHISFYYDGINICAVVSGYAAATAQTSEEDVTV